MATPTPTSRLENLPTELFSRILSYIYNPEACETEGSETKPLGYHFETSLLRTNKGIHRIAKDYLHDELSWVRFDINWASFLIDPHSAGVRYINIRRDPLDYYAFRVPQDAPHGRLHAKIEFPAASTDAQVVMADSVNGDTFPLMSLLVLEKDLTGFLRVLRMNDIAYCLRVFPNTVTDHDVCATPGLHGIKSVITVATGQSMKRYAHLVPEFKVMVGLLHKTKIVGHEDSVLAATITDYIQHRHAYVEQKQLGLTTARMGDKLSRTLMWQAIGYMMRLKDQGEKYLRHGQYSSAHLCYAQTNIFEQGWLKMAPPPEDEFFWTPRNALYDCFGVSMACNTTIAYLAGGLTVKTALPRTMGVLRWYHILLVSAGDRTLSTPRLLELTICMIVYYMLTVDLLDDQYLQALRWAVRTCENAFGVEGRNCLAKDLRPLHAAIKRFAKSEHISTARISQLKTLKALARGVACVPPLKWAIHETDFPSTLQEEMGFLAQIKRMENDVIQNPSDICFEYAQFSEPIGEGRWSAEEGSRYVV